MVVSVGSAGKTARRIGGVFTALVFVLALSASPTSAASKPLPQPVPVADDALARALAAGRLSPARYTLERARSLFRLGAVRREFGDVARPDPHAATMILRDLALRLRQLPAAERREARAILARPDDGSVPISHAWPPGSPSTAACDSNMCFHWITNPARDDAPDLTDGSGNGIPDWVDTTIATFQNVWQTEVVALGYRAPLSDVSSPNNGGDGKLDIYLANLGADGFFGYCSSDDPRLEGGYAFFDISAYCVVDDDFADFGPPWTPQQYLQVTAAHEFKHASQFAYDAAEDLWFMEGDAMWMESQVFPTVTDRFNFLNTSALSHPSISLDHGDDFYEYGAWVFFRFLGEYFNDVAVVREAWARADGSGDSDGIGPDEVGPNDYSMQAVARATADRSVSLTSAFTTFTRWNRTPARPEYYDEGADYPSAPTVASYTLRPSAPTTGWKSRKIRHLASAYYSFRPSRTTSKTADLKVTVDLPNLTQKPAATLLVFLKSGGYSVKPITLNSYGNGAKTVSFGRATVSRVDLVLTNASARFDLSSCWTFTTGYSCGGAIALDENRTYRFTAKLR
jgi:hypothetical protein